MRAPYIGLPPVFAGGDARLKRSSDFVRDRIDRMALRAAVLMVHEKALVMPPDQAGLHQLRHRPANRGHAGFADTLTKVRLDQAIGICPIAWQFSPSSKFRPDLLDGGAALVMSRAARRDRRGQPFPDRHQGLAFTNQRSSLSIRSGNPGDEIEHHEGVARPCRMLCYHADDIRQACRARWRRGWDRWRKEIGLEHGTNQAQSTTLVNPPIAHRNDETAFCHSCHFTSERLVK
ncbi:hypothetical protein DFR49_0770 [Hephaestia caeni]|uniref:Uncharacterized protein n=1 Tax=Hephaestia caeni TaxID=645617 RepID=A0A397PGD7_9SPHN|nr:hypothetical protein DFR49_0770 [Hephaestia caeni]